MNAGVTDFPWPTTENADREEISHEDERHEGELKGPSTQQKHWRLRSHWQQLVHGGL